MRSTKCHWCGEDYNDCNRCTHRGVYVEPERLALLERCAEKWAAMMTIDVYDEEPSDVCECCHEEEPENGPIIHAHDCDAAHILDLEREEKG